MINNDKNLVKNFINGEGEMMMNNNLAVLNNKNGAFTIDSRVVAEMTGKRYADFLREMQGYAKILDKSNFGFTDFFIESSYTTYVTQKGLAFINKIVKRYLDGHYN